MLSLLETVLTRSTPDFLEDFFSIWPITDVFNISRTCFRLRAVYNSYRRTTWDPDTFFSRWFTDPLTFRCLLGRCDAIISGSQALQFFDRTEYEDSDLDIFMRPAGVIRMSEWLRDAGYGLPTVEEDYFFNQRLADAVREDCDIPSFLPTNMRAVFTFVRTTTLPSGRSLIKRVQIIVVDIDPVEFITFDFHSSASTPHLFMVP